MSGWCNDDTRRVGIMKKGFPMKYLINIARIIVLLITYQRSYHHPYAAAFSRSTIVGVKSTYRHRCVVQRFRDSTKAHTDSNVEESSQSTYSQTPSHLIYSKSNDRRAFFRQTHQQISSLILASILMGETSVFAQDVTVTEPFKTKTIVITGANSGIGFEACKRLITKGHTIILACRSMDKAQDAMNRIQQDAAVAMNGKFIPAECDLADLSSIQRFVSGIGSNTKIDTLCLNAGVARNTAATDCARTKDGFELTVGVNHFGHFYLNHLMLPLLANDGRIVVTASSVHDPESPGGAQGVPATLGDLSGLWQFGKDCEMLDGNAFNADKAYKDSKLCNVLFTRELQRRLNGNDTTKEICVNSFSPGLIVGTGLFRDQNPFFIKLFDLAATNLLKVGETPEWGGASLEYMTTMSSKGLFYNSDPGSSKYGDDAFGREFRPMDVSKEGKDDSKAQRLWELTEKVLGIAA